MADNSFVLPLLLIKQMSQTAAHTDMLVCQGTTLSGARNQVENSADEDKDKLERPGKGNATVGSKAPYARRIDAGRYNDIRFLDPDLELFQNTVHLTRDELDKVHDLVRSEPKEAMDVRGNGVSEGCGVDAVGSCEFVGTRSPASVSEVMTVVGAEGGRAKR